MESEEEYSFRRSWW